VKAPKAEEQWTVKAPKAEEQWTVKAPKAEEQWAVKAPKAEKQWAAKAPKAEKQWAAKAPKAEEQPCKPESTEDQPIVVTLDEFLVGRIVSMQKKDYKVPGVYSLTTKSISSLPEEAEEESAPEESAPQILTCPPGLAPPPGLEDVVPLKSNVAMPSEEDKQEKEEPVEMVKEEPKQYKVLLSNLPEAILKECMLRVVFEQAGLPDIMDLKFRADGKALVTFATYASVPRCIMHFRGRQWDNSHMPVQAVYVQTVQRTVNHEQRLFAEKVSAATAPFKFSVDAPVFVPTMSLIDKHNGSDGSTDGPPSDGASSETCESEQMLCA